MVWGGTVSQETHAWFDKSFKKKRQPTKGVKTEVRIAPELPVRRKPRKPHASIWRPIREKVC